MGLKLLRIAALCALFSAALSISAQVFVVGMRTATDDAVVEFQPTHLPLSDKGLTERSARELMQNLVAEQGFAHRGLPISPDLQLLANGNMTPRGDDYRRLLYEKGIAAEPGDRVEVTAVTFKGDRIVIDVNGGPYAKHRFLSHIEVADVPIAPTGNKANGSRITLVFEGGIPEISAAEVKALLAPVIDFTAKSSGEAYANTMPAKVREAVAAHEVLVGMTRRMVLAAVGAPLSKNRERIATGANADPKAPISEEWIYGEPPQPVRFVRFKGERVVRLEIAEMGKPIQVFDKNQIDPDDPAALPENVRVIANGDVAPGSENGEQAAVPPPSLAKPGEKIDAPRGMGKVQTPDDATPSSSPHYAAGNGGN